MMLKKIKVQGLWSFGNSQPTEIEFDKLSVIVGKNNAGKSNVLKTILWLQKSCKEITGDDPNFKLSLPRYKPASLEPSLGDSKHSGRHDAFLEYAWSFGDNLRDYAKRCGVKVNLAEPATVHTITKLRLQLASLADGTNTRKWTFEDSDGRSLFEYKSGVNKPNIRDESAKTIHILFQKWCDSSIHTLDAFRSTATKLSNNESLRQFIQSHGTPPTSEVKLREKFNAMVDHFQNLSGMHGCNIVAPPGSNHEVVLEFIGRYLDVTRYGSGVVHFLIFAAELAINPNRLILLEEPETHLHPERQRALIRTLASIEQLQAIITTHSPAIVNCMEGQTVLHARADKGPTTISSPISYNDSMQILTDIGIHPSDILQSDTTIWVEGPSDRILLKKAIQVLAADLREGIDYQFIPYAGKLRAHLTAEDPRDEKELFKILGISRGLIIVSDLDAESSGGVDSTKRRVHAEVEGIGGLALFTDGREIENMIPGEAVRLSISEFLINLDNFTACAANQKFDEWLNSIVSDKAPAKYKNYARHKVAAARDFAANISENNIDGSPLAEVACEIVRYVRSVSRRADIGKNNE